MPENKKTELELKSNLKVNSDDNPLSASEKRASEPVDIDDRYVRQIAREDDDHPSLSIYVIPFVIICLLGVVWFVVAVEGVGNWLGKFF